MATLKQTKTKSKEYYKKNKERILNHMKEYYKMNKERILEGNKTYRETHKEEISNRRRKFYRENKNKVNSSYRKYRKRNREKILEYSRNRNKKKRIELLKLLGSKCVKCGFSDWRALQIDHVNGGGLAEHKKYGGSIYKLIRRKVIEGSKDYQLLCANCNNIKKFENKECRRV